MDNFTPIQILTIRQAVQAGRDAMAILGNHSLIFAKAFLEADGLQAPGRVLDNETRQQLGRDVIALLGGQPVCLDDEDEFQNIVLREMNRAQTEARLADYRNQTSVLGFAVNFPDENERHPFCNHVVSIDLYGLGNGVFPKNEIVVLPPDCDQGWWEVVYRDQHRVVETASQAA